MLNIIGKIFAGILLFGFIFFTITLFTLIVDPSSEYWWFQRPFKNKIDYNMYQNRTVYVPRGDGRCDITPIKNFPTITFKQFLDFYYLNPDSWILKECRVYKNNNNRLSFTFTYPEWKKYKKWCEQKEKEKENQRKHEQELEAIKKQNEITRQILEEVQKDIDRTRKKSEKEINETIKLIKGVKL